MADPSDAMLWARAVVYYPGTRKPVLAFVNFSVSVDLLMFDLSLHASLAFSCPAFNGEPSLTSHIMFGNGDTTR